MAVSQIEEETTMENIDQSWKGFYRISGILWIILTVLFIAGIFCDFSMNVSPGMPVGELLEKAARERFLFTVDNTIYLINDVLSIMAVLGLYLSLKNVKKNWALPGAAMIILSAIIEIFVRFMNYATIVLSSKYIIAQSESLKAGYMASTDLALEMINIGNFFIAFIWGSGNILTGIAMISGIYKNIIGYIFIGSGILIATGSFGYIITSSLFILLFLGSLPFLLAMILLGLRLYSLGRANPRDGSFELR